jgi:four helix bundle protein
MGELEEKPKITACEMNERLLDYGARVIKLVEALPKSLAARRIADQLLRSSIAVGAHYEEAQAGESREDFVHKLQLALKELRESNYWLRLLMRAGTLPAKRLAKILDESTQLKAILSKAVATTKRKASQ